MVITIDRAIETITWWAGNAQLTNSGKGQGNDFIRPYSFPCATADV